METLGPKKISSILAQGTQFVETSNNKVRHDQGHQVGSFVELAKKIAELQFRNRDYVMLFRGQGKDYLNVKHNTTLKPSIFRPVTSAGKLASKDLATRYARLQNAEQLLVAAYPSTDPKELERLKRQRVLRWSILQHYEVCSTPLLDLTHSLRIATSFASHDRNGSNAYIFVLAVPNISGAITASAEAGVQIMRLSSVCPPSAIRPHIQEGYLLGEYPDLDTIQQKGLYMPYEIDSAQRLIGKFKFDPDTLHRDPNFPLVNKAALYPDADDPLYKMTKKIKDQLGADPTLEPTPKA